MVSRFFNNWLEENGGEKIGLINFIFWVGLLLFLSLIGLWIVDVVEQSQEMVEICEDAGGEKIVDKASCLVDGKIREIVRLKDSGWRVVE